MSDGGPGGQAGGVRSDDAQLLAQVAARLDAQDARLAVRLDELAATLTGRLRALVDDAAAADTTAARLAALEDRTAQLATATAALERLVADLAGTADGLALSAEGLAASVGAAPRAAQDVSSRVEQSLQALEDHQGRLLTEGLATLGERVAQDVATSVAERLAPAVDELGEDLVGVTGRVRRELDAAAAALRAGVEAALGGANAQLAAATEDARAAAVDQQAATAALQQVAERVEHGVVARVEALGEQLAADLAVGLEEQAAALGVVTGELRGLVAQEVATALRRARGPDVEALAEALATRLAGSGGTRSGATTASGRRVVRRVVAGPDGRRAAVARPAPDAALVARLQQVDGVGPVRAAELVAAFPSARALLAADVGDLAALDGVDAALARRVQEHLRS